MIFFTLTIFFIIILLGTIDGRDDDDTENTNTSFKDRIENLHGDFKKCEVKIGNRFTEATAKVNPPFRMPTCLKTHYEESNMRGCGMPLYKKFRYCAKALFFKNRKPEDVDFQKEWKANREILVLIDGCLVCPKYSERAAGVTIKLYSGIPDDKEPLATTISDRFADFKIGAIINMKAFRQIQPKLEIDHYCNQYHVRQHKTLTFPMLLPFEMNNLVFESQLTSIPLPQQNLNELTVDLLG